MPSNKQLRVSSKDGSIGEYPGSSTGPGVVQQHVFKKITTHSLTNEVKSYNPRGGSRILGKGGSKYIHNWGRVRDSKGVWGSADSSPSGVRFFAFAFIFF